MPMNVQLKTVDGRIVQGMNFTLSSPNIPSSVPQLTAQMPGGPTMGVYHILTANGWEYIPAPNISAVLFVKPGVAL